MTDTEKVMHGIKFRIGRLPGSRAVLVTPHHNYGYYWLDLQDGDPPVRVEGVGLYKWLGSSKASWEALVNLLLAKRGSGYKKQLNLDI